MKRLKDNYKATRKASDIRANHGGSSRKRLQVTAAFIAALGLIGVGISGASPAAAQSDGLGTPRIAHSTNQYDSTSVALGQMQIWVSASSQTQEFDVFIDGLYAGTVKGGIDSVNPNPCAKVKISRTGKVTLAAVSRATGQTQISARSKETRVRAFKGITKEVCLRG